MIKKPAIGLNRRFKGKSLFIEGDLLSWYGRDAKGNPMNLVALAVAGNPYAVAALEKDRYSFRDETFYAAWMGMEFVIVSKKDFKIEEGKIILI